MATTTNFGWETPDDTDLVKDGAAAIRTLGSAIDTSLVDLKGGTTGQVLSKTSNTDMDFTWVTSDDANAIQNAIVDAKGDLIAASAADTPARLAVGNNGETLVADSSASAGLRWQGNFAAGKNKIINGDFNIWQRGTSFSNPQGVFHADRFNYNYNGTGSITVSRQTFTPGSAPVSGYESQYFLRMNQTVAGTGGTFNVLSQPIEDVRTLAGQTITVSFWAKADATRNITIQMRQSFGSGGSGDVDTFSSAIPVTTSWARYSATLTIPSVSGKTIGTNSALICYFSFPQNTTQTIDLWGIQVEAGNVATAFQTATGTLAGELAACQRYYYRVTAELASARFATGSAESTTVAELGFFPPVRMRTNPTALEQSGTAADYSLRIGATNITCSAVPTFNTATSNFQSVLFTVASGLTAGNAVLGRYSGTAGYLGWSAEL